MTAGFQPSRPPPRVLRFGPFEADLNTGELRKCGLRLKLQDQPFRVLVGLLDHPGELLTREELRARLWPGDTYVDFEHSLNTAVKKLRQALNDVSDHPCYIETIPRYGYRFIAPVEVCGPETARCAETLPAPAATVKRRRPQWVAAATIVLIGTASVLAGVSVRHYRRAVSPRETALPSVPVVRFSLSPPETYSFRDPVQMALSPDGRNLVVQVRDAAGKEQLWLRALDNPVLQPLAGTEGGGEPAWSADSKSIFFVTSGGLKRVALPASAPETICKVEIRGRITVNRDGTILFGRAGRVEPIYRISEDDCTPKPVTRFDPSRGEYAHWWPKFLPDGRHFLYVGMGRSGVQNANYAALYVGSVDSPESRLLVENASNGEYASPGYLFYARNSYLTAQPFDLGRLQITGDPLPIIDEQLAFVTDWGLSRFTVSDTGVLAYQTEVDRTVQLLWLNREGKQIGSLGTGLFDAMRLSNKGDKLAVVKFEPKTHKGDVWIVDLSRGTWEPFTFSAATDVSPTWSPDDSQIVFSANRTGMVDLYRKRLDGAGGEEILLQTGFNKMLDDWSPEGRSILYTSAVPKSGFGLYLLHLSGGTEPIAVTPLSDVHALAARYSPDGRWVAYLSYVSGKPEIYIRPSLGTGRSWQISSGAAVDQAPEWRKDGKELFYVSADWKIMAVPLSKASTPTPPYGTPHPLFSLPRNQNSPFDPTFAVAPDGKKFLVEARIEQRTSRPVEIVSDWIAMVKK